MLNINLVDLNKKKYMENFQPGLATGIPVAHRQKSHLNHTHNQIRKFMATKHLWIADELLLFFIFRKYILSTEYLMK